MPDPHFPERACCSMVNQLLKKECEPLDVGEEEDDPSRSTGRP